MIATVTTTITVAAGVLMTVVDHKHFPLQRVGAVVGRPDRDDRRLRRCRSRATPFGQIVAAFVMLLGIGFVTVITASITGAFVARREQGRPGCG